MYIYIYIYIFLVNIVWACRTCRPQLFPHLSRGNICGPGGGGVRLKTLYLGGRRPASGLAAWPACWAARRGATGRAPGCQGQGSQLACSKGFPAMWGRGHGGIGGNHSTKQEHLLKSMFTSFF